MVTVTQVLPADGALDVWCDHYCAGYTADSGTTLSAQALAARIRAKSPSAEVHRLAAWLSSELVGVAQSSPDRDAAFLRMYVSAPYRRRGVGSALLRAVCAQSGSTRLRATANAGEAGERFATAVGAHVVMRLVVMSQPLREIDLGKTHTPDGYQLVTWQNAAPDALLLSYAAAKAHIADAPNARYQVDAAWDIARVRDWEAAVRASGHALWVCAALHDDVAVAFSEVEVGPNADASQHDTVVLPTHRGGGLATGVKTELAQLLCRERPDITRITSTINAEHGAMIAINRRIGYRVVRNRLLVQADIGL